MEKVYKMPGYDLHLIPTNKFKYYNFIKITKYTR